MIIPWLAAQNIPEVSGPLHWTQILVLMAFAIPSSIAAVYSVKGHGQARDTNDAVNHRHEKPEGSPRMYDAMLAVMEDVGELKRWKDRWDELPEDLSSGHELADRFDEIDMRLQAFDEGFRRNDETHNLIIGMIAPKDDGS